MRPWACYVKSNKRFSHHSNYRYAISVLVHSCALLRKGLYTPGLFQARNQAPLMDQIHPRTRFTLRPDSPPPQKIRILEYISCSAHCISTPQLDTTRCSVQCKASTWHTDIDPDNALCVDPPIFRKLVFLRGFFLAFSVCFQKLSKQRKNWAPQTSERLRARKQRKSGEFGTSGGARQLQGKRHVNQR